MSSIPDIRSALSEYPQDYSAGRILVSETLAEAYRRLPDSMRTIMEHGNQQENYVICTQEELFEDPQRFGLSGQQLDDYKELIAQYGEFEHQGRRFILASSADLAAPILQWMGLSAMLQELRIEPHIWQDAVLDDLGLKPAAVPNHLVDALPMRKQYGPAIARSLKTHLGLNYSAEHIDLENPRYWVQMVAMNAVLGHEINGASSSATLPKTQAVYDAFVKRAAQKAQSLEDAALIDQQTLAKAHLGRSADAPKPRFFTKDPEERSLLLQATRFLEASILKDPAAQKFRCRLNAAKSGYSITMVIGNGREAPKEYTLQTHAKNLDQAVELKRALQSHMLNRIGVAPLRYTHYEHSAELRANEIIPVGLVPPSSVELRNGYYIARFKGEELHEGDTKTVEMIFPLGVKLDEDQPALSASSAEKRLEWLTTRLQGNDHYGVHETRDELTTRMRQHFVKQQGKRWHEAPTLNLQGMEDGPVIDLGFPGRTRGQTTTLSATNVRYTGSGRDAEGNISNNAEDSRNPSWHLSFVLTVQSNGQEYKYHPTIRLQTSNEEAALRKAELIIGQLQKTFADLAGKNEDPYPELRWQLRDAKRRGEIKLITENGVTLPSPEPQYLSDMVDDVVALVKSDFHLHTTFDPDASHNNPRFNVAVHRGQAVEQDVLPYKGTDNRLLIRTLSAVDHASAETFAAAVNTSFRDAIQSDYSTRNEHDGKRIPLRPFGDHSIQARFHDAINDHLKDRRFADKITELEHATAMAQQGQSGRVKG